MPNALNINGAGGSASNPILSGLPIDLVAGAETCDIVQGVAAFVDSGEGFPGTNSVTSGLVPASTIVEPAGLTGSYVASTQMLTVTNVGSAEAGMYIGLSQGATKTYAAIAEVVSSTELRLAGSPFSVDTSNIAYQIWYVLKVMAGSSSTLSDAAGKLNVFKFQAADALGNLGNNGPGASFYIRDAPSNLVTVNGGHWQNQRVAVPTPNFDILPSWANRGGIASLQLVTSSGISWWDNTTAEKSITSILTQTANNRLKLNGGDGTKTATLRARTYVGGSRYKDIANLLIELDSSAPVVSAIVEAAY